MEKYYSVRQVAAILSVSEAAIRRWVRERKLQVVCAGRLIRIPENAINSFLQAKPIKISKGRDQDV